MRELAWLRGLNTHSTLAGATNRARKQDSEDFRGLWGLHSFFLSAHTKRMNVYCPALCRIPRSTSRFRLPGGRSG